MAASQRIEHPLQPVFDGRSRVLVLGTMPSPASRTAGFYYGHPQNRFWKVLGALWDEHEPLGVEGRTAFLLAHRIAVWDVLAACDIEGASDASIAHAVPNDLRVVIDHAPHREGVHHRIEGGRTVPPPVRARPSRPATHGAALDQPRQRPHAPCRPGGGVRAHQRHACRTLGRSPAPTPARIKP